MQLGDRCVTFWSCELRADVVPTFAPATWEGEPISIWFWLTTMSKPSFSGYDEHIRLKMNTVILLKGRRSCQASQTTLFSFAHIT